MDILSIKSSLHNSITVFSCMYGVCCEKKEPAFTENSSTSEVLIKIVARQQ